STSVKRPMPLRANASTAHEPTPPIPTTVTWQPASRASAPCPYRRSMPPKRSCRSRCMHGSLAARDAWYRRPQPFQPPPGAAMSNVDPNRRPSSLGRYLFLLILGLVLGAVATVMALRAIEQRKDHFPDALMHVQQWHMGQL